MKSAATIKPDRDLNHVLRLLGGDGDSGDKSKREIAECSGPGYEQGAYAFCTTTAMAYADHSTTRGAAYDEWITCISSSCEAMTDTSTCADAEAPIIEICT